MQGATVVFDIETGGLEDRHPIIQLAAIAVDARWAETAAFERKIAFDARRADPQALALNSYDEARWRDEAVEARVAAQGFADFCRAHASMELVSRQGKPYRCARLAGHNAVGFDIPRVRDLMEAHDIWWPACWWYPLDTYQGALWHFARSGALPPADFKLPTLAAHFGLPTEGAHDALADVRMAAGIARAILG
jgi:DNA polymerase III epsilon subunit-like protein